MEQKTAIQEMDETAKRRKEEKLTEAVKLVQEEIRACRERYRKIANGEEHSPIMIEGETETGYPCELMADPKTVAKVYARNVRRNLPTTQRPHVRIMRRRFVRSVGLEKRCKPT